jgi:hypothetical protein
MTRQQLVNCSTATQTVFDAFWPLGMYPDDMDAGNLALALRAVADQVAPAVYFAYTGNGDWDHGMEAKNDEIREAILTIANELEGVE